MRTPKVQKQPTSKPTWKTVLMDPKVAAHILDEAGVDIKRLNPAVLKNYADEMRAGRWALNGDAIIYNVHGKLLDGKLRLAACVVSDSAFPTFVVEKVGLDAEITIDSHRKRKSSDILYIAGRDDATSLSTTANSVMQMIRGIARLRNVAVSTQAVKAFVDANPDLATSISYVECMQLKTPSRALVAALHFLTWKIDREKCETFFTGLNDAATTHSDETTPYATLARAIVDLKAEDLTPPAQREVLHVFLVKAWNAFMDGAAIENLQYGHGEEIPLVTGVKDGMVDMGQGSLPSVKKVQKDYQQALHGNGITIEIVTIRPVDAEAMLLNNGPSLEEQKRNRKRSSATIDLYARDMKRGNWRLNGQAIKISASGSLLDGQHRAAACVKSGVAFETLVIRGLPDTVFSTYDLHAKKNFSKIVGRLGYANGGIVASALRILWQYENYGLESAAYPTHIELNETLNRHGKHLPLSVTIASRRNTKNFCAVSTMAGIHFILTDLSDRSKEFFDRFESGADLSIGNPILTLRDKLNNDRKDKLVTSSERDRLIFITRAWRAFIDGKKLLLLKKGGSFEPFFAQPHPLGVSKKIAA